MKINNSPVMFHDFHKTNDVPNTKGSINHDYLNSLIKYIGKNNILSPNEYLHKFKKNKLNPNHTCFTFDDALKSQIKIAYPILANYKIKAFFFIPSCFVLNKSNVHETYKDFYMKFYKKINYYYDDFYFELNKIFNQQKIKIFIKSNDKKIKYIKKIKKFYSFEDIKFRLIRDYLIDNKLFNKINLKLFKSKNFNYLNINKKKYFHNSDLINLSKENIIGLHSYNHYTNLKSYDYKKHESEYKDNLIHLEKIVKNQKINTLSYPCGSYNLDSVKILKKLKIQYAFRNINMKMNYKYENSNRDFFIGRVNHINFKNLI